jgi:hypothetical protein
MYRVLLHVSYLPYAQHYFSSQSHTYSTMHNEWAGYHGLSGRSGIVGGPETSVETVIVLPCELSTVLIAVGIGVGGGVGRGVGGGTSATVGGGVGNGVGGGEGGKQFSSQTSGQFSNASSILMQLLEGFCAIKSQ